MARLGGAIIIFFAASIREEFQIKRRPLQRNDKLFKVWMQVKNKEYI